MPPFQHSSFTSRYNTEHFFSLTADPDPNFSRSCQQLLQAYTRALQEHHCDLHTEVWIRIHLSDPSTQYQELERQLKEQPHGFASVIGQAPSNLSKMAIEAYHLQPLDVCEGQRLPRPVRHIEKTEQHQGLSLQLQNYQLYLHKSLDSRPRSAFEQTQHEFEQLEAALTAFNGNIPLNTIRTWLYVRDIDNRYGDVVQCRNKVFDRLGLTPITHSIASTGIEGQCPTPHQRMTMDSLSYLGIQEPQVSFLNAEHLMPPTHLYGVRFERGTRVSFGDRCHDFISGTASIDREGNVVHPEDIRKQTQHMLHNFEQLLVVNDANIKDLKMATVYLRDHADAPWVEEELSARLGHVPTTFVKAPVCRPSWLVEIEGIAIHQQQNPTFPDFY